MKRVWIVFGRLNPPHLGHKKMLDQLKKLAGHEDFMIWPTWSQGKAKDPLDHLTKLGWIKKMFPEYVNNIKSDKQLRPLPFVLQHLMMENYTDVVIVCGSDRTKDFAFNVKWNRKETGEGKAYYAFDTVTIDSTGLERDPDSDGTSGLSASLMRDAAKNTKTRDFLGGIGDLLNTDDALELMADVRKGLGL